MSEGAWLACVDCHVTLLLGKAVWTTDTSGEISYFASGDRPASENPLRSRALWKMLAEHVGHRLEVVRERSARFREIEELDDNEQLAYRGIDSNTLGLYLRGWPG